MSDAFLDLPASERGEALSFAASESGRPPHLLEKDVMVVWALSVLGSSGFDPHLVFKGGTSLSKAYGAIDRFSEDIDLTYDIREIAPDLVAKTKDGWPESNSQQKSWTKDIRTRLDRWVSEEVAPIFRSAMWNITPIKRAGSKPPSSMQRWKRPVGVCFSSNMPR